MIRGCVEEISLRVPENPLWKKLLWIAKFKHMPWPQECDRRHPRFMAI